jgi:outer membrane protein assembly factor BamB
VLSIIVISSAFLALCIGVRPKAQAANATISLSTNHAYPSFSLQVKGTSFGTGESIFIQFDTTLISNTVTTGTGSFVRTITIPRAALPGNHTIQATGQTSGLSAQKLFLVQTNWDGYGFNQYGTRFNRYENVLTPANASTLVQDWSYTTSGSILSSPAVANGIVYVGSDDDSVYALNAASGALVWRYSTGSLVRSSPAIANGIVYIGSIDHKLYALNALTGSLLWTYTTGLFIESPPLIVNDVVYFGSDDHTVYALNAKTGRLLWNYTTRSDIGFASPVVANGLVYIGSEDDTIYALNALTGAFIWNFTAGDEIYNTSAVANGIVYVVSKDDKLYALKAMTGALLWSYRTRQQSLCDQCNKGFAFVELRYWRFDWLIFGCHRQWCALYRFNG